MNIKLYAGFEFTDDGDGCSENNKELCLQFKVPEFWSTWSNEEKAQWFKRNEDQILEIFRNAMEACELFYTHE